MIWNTGHHNISPGTFTTLANQNGQIIYIAMPFENLFRVHNSELGLKVCPQ